MAQGIVAVGQITHLRRTINLCNTVEIPRSIQASYKQEAGHAHGQACRSWRRSLNGRWAWSLPQQPHAHTQSHLKWPVPQRIFQQAMNSQHHQHAPGQQALNIQLLPRSATQHPSRYGQDRQGRKGNAQLQRQMQRQIVRVVQHVAKPFARIARHEMRKISLCPAPTQPRMLRNHVQSVRPQHMAAGAHGVTLGLSCHAQHQTGAPLSRDPQGQDWHQHRSQQHAQGRRHAEPPKVSRHLLPRLALPVQPQQR